MLPGCPENLCTSDHSPVFATYDVDVLSQTLCTATGLGKFNKFKELPAENYHFMWGFPEMFCTKLLFLAIWM